MLAFSCNLGSLFLAIVPKVLISSQVVSCNGSWLFTVQVVRVWYNQGITIEQCLLWVTCTGRHWLIALWIMIGAIY